MGRKANTTLWGVLCGNIFISASVDIMKAERDECKAGTALGMREGSQGKRKHRTAYVWMSNEEAHDFIL